MSLPYRVSLPHPLPENVVVFPGALDRLILRFGALPVQVESEATGAAAPFRDAVDKRRLGFPDTTGDAFDIPITGIEAKSLAAFADLAEAWSTAYGDRDLYGLMAVVAAVHRREAPWWLDVRFEMPGRQVASLTA